MCVCASMKQNARDSEGRGTEGGTETERQTDRD